MKRAALYARVSTDQQREEATIESQVAELKERIKKDGNTLSSDCIYLDDGYSGQLLNRPALDRVRDDAQKELFDKIYVYDRGRLSRNFAHQEVIIEELRDLGIEFTTLHDVSAVTDTERVLQGMQGLFHEYERVKISERMRRGKIYKVKSGRLLGYNAPYGYTYIPKTTNADGRFEISEVEAETVKQIFNWVGVEQASIREVIRRLHKKEIRPQKRKRSTWTKGPVIRLLQNETYTGVHYYNKTESVVAKRKDGEKKYHRIKKTSRKKRPKEDWLAVEVPSIIPRDLFEKVQNQLKENAKYASRNRKHPYLLVGLIFCSCGKRRTGEGRNHKYYRCTDRLSRFPLPRKCHAAGVNATVADTAVWNKLVYLLTNEKLLLQQAERWLKSHQSPPKAGKLTEEAEAKLREIATQETRYAEAYGEGTMPYETYKELSRKLAERKKLLKSVGVEKNTPIQISPIKLARLAQQAVARLTFDDRQRLARKLVKKVTVESDKLIVCGILPITAPGKVGLRAERRHRRPPKRR